jgi:hypothetical protein
MAASQASGTPAGVKMVDSGPLFERWQHSDGSSMRVDWNRTGAVRITVTGHGHVEYAPPAIARWDAALASGSRPVMLIDFWGMPTYDSGMRVQMTGWGVKHRSEADFYVCTQSKLVLMGLAVANLALSGLLHVIEERQQFDIICVKKGLPLRK